jgi:2-polyprenyl-3-methyl-5-hydroxy-6-metoxy-1,4-benzoquinol methylase
MTGHKNACRFCGAPLRLRFCDLGLSPPSNAYLREQDLGRMEAFYPLQAEVCEKCLLVQVPEFETPEQIFTDYAYFSSFSDSWLEHCKQFVAEAITRFGMDARSRVVEIASNDGYLLQYFKQAGVPVLGVEPAANVARVARERGIESLVRFFGVPLAQELADQGKQADLVICNNVFAHVPDLNDFTRGLYVLLKPNGVVSIEFPHLQRLIEQSQFDTIYHEHFCYFSFQTACRVLAHHGLKVFDVAQIPTHGGSLRVMAQRAESGTRPVESRVAQLTEQEERFGINRIELYLTFDEKARAVKRDLLEFLINAKRAGKTVAGYGAPAKGNTLLNYCGIRQDFVDYTVDRNTEKQGRYLPGTLIPVHAPEMIKQTRPDYVLILPWNIKDEVIQQTSYIREWGGRFVIPIPSLQVLD